MTEKIGAIQSFYTKKDTKGLIDIALESGHEVVNYGTDLDKIDSSIDMIMIVGGDGLIRSVADLIVSNDLEIPMVIVEGGTCNTFFRSVVDVGNIFDPESFFNEPSASDFLTFHPGLIEDQIFTVDTGVGSTEPQIGIINENLRKIFDIGGHRPKLAAFLAWSRMLFSDLEKIPPFNLYSISSHYGFNKAFPDQDLQDNMITHAWVGANSKNEAVLKSFFAFYFLGKGNLSSISKAFLKQEQGTQFIVDYPINQLRLGGDTLDLEIEEGFTIKRSDKSLNVVALST